MEVIILGSGSPLPHPERAGPSTLVRAAGSDFLFDCGRGVLMRAAAVPLLPVSLKMVLLTHLHSDHVSDFNDVVTTRWVMSPAPNPLAVIGPVGTRKFVEATLRAMESDIGYRLAHHQDLNTRPELITEEVERGVVFENGPVKIIAAPTDHRPVHPSLGFRIEAEGKSIVIAGDTIPCEGLDRLCRDADVLIQTVIRRSLVEAVPSQRFKDILDYHSTTVDAGRTAARCRVKTLLLNHCVPTPAPGTEEDWMAEAANHFTGKILISYDLLKITL
ncbi:MAG: MBL fold metallo-hydrolase [Deltaproteobacteria bacterium]|nr:MBL fold metallo-hydrolase [Deltaproteobacteria bacterium]